MSFAETVFCVGILNSFVLDWLLRQKITTHLNMFYVYQAPVPRLTAADPRFEPIVRRAARLICTTPEFDALAQQVAHALTPGPSGASGQAEPIVGVTDPAERARLRAELDGLVAHLYDLTEEEFAHILTTFPLVPEPVKTAALQQFREQSIAGSGQPATE